MVSVLILAGTGGFVLAAGYCVLVGAFYRADRPSENLEMWVW